MGTGGWEGGGVGDGWVGSWRWVIPSINSDVSSVSDRNRLNPQDRSRRSLLQSDTSHILVNAIHWPHRPYSAPWWFERVSKKRSMEADLAIYSHVFGVSG